MSSVGSVVGSQLGMLVAPAAPVACLGATGGHGLARVCEEPRGRGPMRVPGSLSFLPRETRLCVCVLSLLFFTAADLFTDLENAFQGKIDAAYFETSKYLLDVLNRKYSLLDHMQAVRRYLLLGQGDFIRHLMDLLK